MKGVIYRVNVLIEAVAAQRGSTREEMLQEQVNARLQAVGDRLGRFLQDRINELSADECMAVFDDLLRGVHAEEPQQPMGGVCLHGPEVNHRARHDPAVQVSAVLDGQGVAQMPRKIFGYRWWKFILMSPLLFVVLCAALLWVLADLAMEFIFAPGLDVVNDWGKR